MKKFYSPTCRLKPDIITIIILEITSRNIPVLLMAQRPPIVVIVLLNAYIADDVAAHKLIFVTIHWQDFLTFFYVRISIVRLSLLSGHRIL